MADSLTSTVALAQGQPASGVLHAALLDALLACDASPAAFSLPAESDVFRRTYAACLPEFEAVRLAHPDSHDIARHAVSSLERSIVWKTGDGEQPLAEALDQGGNPLGLKCHDFSSSGGWAPRFQWQGHEYDGAELASLGERLVSRQVITREAADALSRVQNRLVNSGIISLRERRVAMLGAGAEMAPTAAWLRAGADVLWLDTVAPPAAWFSANDFNGRLFWPDKPVDLLTRPQEVLATLLAWSEAGPVDLGLYAYAPGQAREMRLTGVMNAIVNALPPGRIRSVTLLVSPTTPARLSAADRSAMATRKATQPVWQKLLTGVGLLSSAPGCSVRGEVAVSRSVVGIQGASYQAAQYIGKVLTAECWARTPEGFRVSANTAAITRTRSLEHPVFAAAFGGTSAFDVETMLPEQSRVLNGLLALHDWFAESPPVPGTVRVHGGVHVLPCPLESALKAAAAIGFARSPRLIAGLFR